MATTKLDTTISAFQDQITAFAVGKATRNIETWRKDLADAGPEFEDIVSDLEKLEGCLKEEQGDSKEIGKVLGKLAKATKKAAKGVDSNIGEKLETLSELMTKSSKEDFNGK